MNDALLLTLEHLERLEPDRARAERVRGRGHAAMAKRRAARRSGRRGPRPAAWGPALAAGFCAAYLSELLWQALHLYGFV